MKAKHIFFLFFVVALLGAGATLISKTEKATSSVISSETTSLIGMKAPEIQPGKWINTCPLQINNLRGKIVLVEFWTFGCYNCRNTVPYLKAWNKQFSGDSLVIIGVHTPEFDLEKSAQGVERQIKELGIQYAVVTDNDYKTWNAYRQEYWPTLYLIDKKGTVRYVHIGEGNYHETEQKIKSLLAESSGS